MHRTLLRQYVLLPQAVSVSCSTREVTLVCFSISGKWTVLRGFAPSSLPCHCLYHPPSRKDHEVRTLPVNPLFPCRRWYLRLVQAPCMPPLSGPKEPLSPVDASSSLNFTWFITSESWEVRHDRNHWRGYVHELTVSGSQEPLPIPGTEVKWVDNLVWEVTSTLTTAHLYQVVNDWWDMEVFHNELSPFPLVPSPYFSCMYHEVGPLSQIGEFAPILLSVDSFHPCGLPCALHTRVHSTEVVWAAVLVHWKVSDFHDCACSFSAILC